jgi:hypothetical protein
MAEKWHAFKSGMALNGASLSKKFWVGHGFSFG